MGEQGSRDEKRRRPRLLPIGYISTSMLGLCLFAVLTFTIPFDRRMPTIELTLLKPLIGVIFGIICILGVMAGVFPSKCSGVSHFQKTENDAFMKTQRTPNYEGHHPTCGKFSSHVLPLGNKTYCGGCMGLVTGAVISLTGLPVFFLNNVGLDGVSVGVFWVGFIGVAMGLLQYNLPFNTRIGHFFLNVCFVLGAFLLLVGLWGVNPSFVLNIYLLTLVIYWILSRILLSQYEHSKVCANCPLECGMSFNSL